jgi:glycosyltransferase involved in cell wall biosynthesis
MAIRVLQVHPGLVPPPKDPERAEYYFIRNNITGDILLPTWVNTADELREQLGSFPTYQVNNFTYHMELAGPNPYGTLRQKWHVFRFHLRTGLKLGRRQRYDCVKAYGSGLTGLVSVLLAKLLRTKLIVELPGAPEDTYRYARFGDSYRYARTPDLATRLAKMASNLVLKIIILSADRVQLLYSWQLQAYPRLQTVPASVVHIFSTVSKVPVGTGEDGSVLLVGAPWYVKGVDVLIRAWRKIEREFPASKLRILGYFPEEDLLKEMAGDSTQIEVLKARPNPETLKLIAECSVFVLASRTEGTPRVFIEAMAAGKPVIGSNVGGVRTLIRDSVNGFLFESENSDQLADKLRLLLSSPELRRRFGEAGRQIAITELDELTFGSQLSDMIEETIYERGSRLETDARPRNGADIFSSAAKNGEPNEYASSASRPLRNDSSL